MVDTKTSALPESEKPVGKATALPQDFETALAQLEALVAKMENGSLALDQSLASYEEGVELAKICQRRLDQAEQQVKVLQGNLLKPLAGTPDGDEE
ncbi:exodeoxyribonuclease VII small subunit [Pollutimonas subterranea]|uniref:Exodeoxyribonuclease 7 small subunit n=1 Tax=Pollutimonas subterranea TaxID=2045210 RepID=A0A2N4U840_9BURK|nr:exodeoxyribonuclease VII small subunit [Pollutimonas subterranea]PLC51185.1 exodeoxyribonuclease VII small subunit [Pollutimonas subterranea]